MRNHLAIIAAASLTVGGLALAQDQTQKELGPGVQSSVRVDKDSPTAASVKLPEGVRQTEKDDSQNIRETLADLSEAAVERDAMQSFVACFVDADRNRLKPWFDNNKDKLNNLHGRIAQIQIDWEKKYGKKIDIDRKLVFGDQYKGFEIVQGEIENPQLLTNWPVKNDTVDDDRQPVPPGHLQPGHGRNLDAEKPFGGDRNLDEGRNVAVVMIPGGDRLPEVNVSLIHEMPDSWKIDVPDNMTGQQLHDSLLHHLTEFGQMKDRWPADANQASRLLAHRVLLGIYNVHPRPDGVWPEGGMKREMGGPAERN